MSAEEAMPLAFCGFAAIASLTFFFSFRRQLFVRVFVTRSEWKQVLRSLPKDPEFGRGMRMMALLQFLLAATFGAVGLWLEITQ